MSFSMHPPDRAKRNKKDFYNPRKYFCFGSNQRSQILVWADLEMVTGSGWHAAQAQPPDTQPAPGSHGIMCPASWGCSSLCQQWKWIEKQHTNLSRFVQTTGISNFTVYSTIVKLRILKIRIAINRGIKKLQLQISIYFKKWSINHPSVNNLLQKALV